VWQTVMSDQWRLAETWCKEELAYQPHGRCIAIRRRHILSSAKSLFLRHMDPHAFPSRALSTYMSMQGSLHLTKYAAIVARL
jgi:hypothetical protein